MEYFKAEVKKYEKKYKKQSETGKIKHMTRFQYSISLNKENPFKNEDYVYLLDEKGFEESKNKLDQYADDNRKLTDQLDVLRNRYDHLQARFNKCQEEQNKLEREISYLRLLMMEIKKRNIFARILNHLPEGLKQLEEGREL